MVNAKLDEEREAKWVEVRVVVKDGRQNEIRRSKDFQVGSMI